MSTSSNVLFIADFKFEQRRKRENQDGATGSALGKGLTDKTMCDLTRSFAQPISERDYRNRALFSLMSKTGLRAKEVVSLKFSNIFSAPSGESLIKYLKKGGNLGYAVIAEETLAFIRECLRARSKSPKRTQNATERFYLIPDFRQIQCLHLRNRSDLLFRSPFFRV
ncbi:tyrosine-type recombinase/integrase [Leptospira weilii]|uniref:tyrosine-type recombinase/integrase n=1 Tax=Leptospira weilii TaxID=28184 RepID=UPI002FCD517C